MSTASETLDTPPPPAEDAISAQQGRRVALLSDARFFVRSVPVAENAAAADVASQAELALETMSPFPVAQLYHGYFWKPGARHALVYAAYRRRFASQETDEWADCDLVIPAFVSVLDLDRAGARTAILASADTMTAIRWDDEGPVPSKVVTEPIPAEATDDERVRIRSGLLTAVGESGQAIDLQVPVTLPGDTDDDFEFDSGGRTSTLPSEHGDALDVRDKEDLAARRRSRNRDVWLWRTFIGLVIVLLLLGAGELGTLGLKAWEKQRQAKLAAQQPDVDKVMKAHTQAARIEKITTDRLRPFEMLDIAESGRPPMVNGAWSILFTDAATNGVYGLNVSVKTSAPADLSTFEANLRNNPAVASAAIDSSKMRNQSGEFTAPITINFKPEALKAMAKTHP